MSWDNLPDTVRIQDQNGRSHELIRIVLQYEYCHGLISSTSGKTLYFTVILPLVLEKLSLSQLIYASRISGPRGLLSDSHKS